MAEYVGGGWKGFIVVLEGRGGKGWSSFSLKLHSVLYFVHENHNGGSRPQPVGFQRGGHFSHGLYGKVLLQALKLPDVVVGYRCYVEVLKEYLATSSSTRGTSGNFSSTLKKGKLTGMAALGYVCYPNMNTLINVY